ncbi:(2Fe-2S)-binding protein [Rhodococcoides fascians]|uniref:(2Fe-2S)-binding protein n=1 Tax=Rhodococcoides fascians TaxID=1828 RepID=UPI0009349E73|nr:(2Fe-2S)-binding protein [Rhodococcus fascians]
MSANELDNSVGARHPQSRVDVSTTVNGRTRSGTVNSRDTLADYLRTDLAMTGTKLGCEHGVCGACTILVDDSPARSCLMLAPQADGKEIRTVESLDSAGRLNALQLAFQKHHALQCGFCTAGFLMSATALLERDPTPGRGDIVEALSGNLCRCTGYETIVDAVLEVSEANSRGAAATVEPGSPVEGSVVADKEGGAK